jgi:hypothetical protein
MPGCARLKCFVLSLFYMPQSSSGAAMDTELAQLQRNITRSREIQNQPREMQALIEVDVDCAPTPLGWPFPARCFIAVVNVPAFLAGFGRSAAGEYGHSVSNSGIEGVGKPSYSFGLNIRTEMASVVVRRDRRSLECSFEHPK